MAPAPAADPVKDQTDFLARISYDQLRHLIFPLGRPPHQRVRRIAEEVRPQMRAARTSQGICLQGKINYNDFIERHLGTRPGPVIEIETGKKSRRTPRLLVPHHRTAQSVRTERRPMVLWFARTCATMLCTSPTAMTHDGNMDARFRSNR